MEAEEERKRRLVGEEKTAKRQRAGGDEASAQSHGAGGGWVGSGWAKNNAWVAAMQDPVYKAGFLPSGKVLQVQSLD